MSCRTALFASRFFIKNEWAGACREQLCVVDKMDKFLEHMAKAIDEHMEHFGGKLFK